MREREKIRREGEGENREETKQQIYTQYQLRIQNPLTRHLSKIEHYSESYRQFLDLDLVE